MGEKEASIKLESTRSDGSNGGPAVEASVVTPPTTKIEERLKLAVEEAVIDKNRSPGLVPLALDYEKLKKQLRSLVTSAKTYHQHTVQIQKSRDELIHNLAIMSEDSPIYEEIGTPLDETASQHVKVLIAAKKEDTVKKSVRDIVTDWEGSQPQVSFQCIQQLASAQGHVDTMEFQTHVLDYVAEWEKVITTRIDSEWKDVKKLAADRGHYENKVEVLRKKTNEMQAKGKVTPSATAEKLQRNEEKLKEAFEIYELAAGKLCVLIEEATTGGWRDLYPLVKNVMKWEANRVGRESDIYAKLLPTLVILKNTYVAADKSKSKNGNGNGNGKSKTKK